MKSEFKFICFKSFVCGLLTLFLLVSCSSGPKPSISSTEPELRYRALIKLDHQKRLKWNLDVVAELVIDDPDPLVRALSASYVGKYKYREGVSALIKALGDEKAVVREAAVKALGVLWEKQAIKPLLELLVDDPSGTVRRSVAHALGEIGHPDALPALIQRLDDIDSSVAYAALKALQKITHQPFGPDREKWEKWLKEQKKQ